MSDELVIEQKQGPRNTGTQIGVQNNYGLSVSDATQMAFAMFREYYPQLREEALTELHNLVETKLSTIPQEYIEAPKARVVVPVVQNASITEEFEIREFYANLLVNSMNKIVKNGVHPGFVEIIKQISPDEAKILKYMSNSHQTIPTISLSYENRGKGSITIIDNFSTVGEEAGCEFPYQVQKCFDNLCRLGLLYDAKGMSSFTDKTKYEHLKNHKNIAPFATEERAKQYGKETFRFDESIIKLTSFGNDFCSICLETRKVINTVVK